MTMQPGPIMQPAIIIPAHNEAAVIEQTLRGLLAGFARNEITVIVAANGCSDDTVARARAVADWITVLDIPEAGKTGAIRAAEAQLGPGPRLYLDADVAMSAVSAKAVLPGFLPVPVELDPRQSLIWPTQVGWFVHFSGPAAEYQLCNKSFPVAEATHCRGKHGSSSARSPTYLATISLPHASSRRVAPK
jgi:cellulose synthase/poly-beta-1,6-N-acetylglucosamine synthase-like glycosyltransferase